MAPGEPQGGGESAGFLPGITFGGNLRSGPGANFPLAGNTQERQRVSLLQDSGIYFNGYSFWLIQLPNGQQAYQWGGLLCAPGFNATGIFNEGC